MGKKNDFEASGSGSKRVPLPVTGRLMHGKWMCDDARPRAIVGRAHRGSHPSSMCASSTEHGDPQGVPPSDLAPIGRTPSSCELAYVLSTETDRRRRRLHGRRDFPSGLAPPARPRRQDAPMRRQQAPTRRQQTQHNDDDDYIEALAYHSEEAMAEGHNFDFPENMTYDEMVKLGVLVSENDAHLQPPLPRYATGVMPPGLSADEALRQAPPTRRPPPPPPRPYPLALSRALSLRQPPPRRSPWALHRPPRHRRHARRRSGYRG
ncbi:hypothetical protein QYE76_043753 [Lolium multiflorum]|uniref:Uncharacterized protein n=1 Tax=Lolium multiflorum TaxID=4521 RepID=A0AAD8WW46_LOLMU|nr:hypothetical protein QYE76_043753 [Lolium multiflorum]